VLSSGEQTTAHPLTVAELTELAGGLAHELRNPLSTMMVNLKLLAEDLRNPKANNEDVRRRALQRVEVLRREAERLQGLFDDFLRTTGPCRLERKTVNLHDLATHIAHFFEPLAKSHNVELIVQHDGPPPVASVDADLLNQAILNLVINAQEAMPQGGRITIQTRRDGDTAVITITDTGVGISPEQRDRIMRPFFSTKGTGTGLGLSVTRRIIHEHGGSLDFTSQPGHGTTFTIRLPINEPSATRNGSTPAEGESEAPAEPPP
jgi:two-component system, NtrC family, sensor histidine kinase HydH